MRDFLNAILAFIGTESLTDLEWESLDLSVQEYTQEVYLALLGILDDRESLSTTRDRLTFYFKARGVDVTPTSVGKSNIFAGASLCD